VLIAPHLVRRVKPDVRGLAPISGTVVIEMDIDETGKVTQACTVKGLRDDVDDAAVRAVRQWRFTPGQSRSRVAVPVIQAVAVPVDIK
jgi:TonB family protein